MSRRWAALILVMAIVFVSGTAAAEREVRGTIALYLAEGGNDLSRSGVVKTGEPFELVVVIDAESRANAAIFQITELNLLFPGVFKVSTWKYNDTFMDLGNNDIGEYVLAYMECAEAGPHEVARVGYSDVNGDLPENVLLYVDGLPNDEIHAVDLEGAPGYVDCDESDYYALAPAAWDDDSFDPGSIDGVTRTEGLLVLNPSLIVPVETHSVSTLKAKF